MARQFKTLVIISLFVTTFCVVSRGGLSSPSRGDGKLSLYSYRSNETAEAGVHSNNRYDTEELAKVNRLMRCRGNNSVFPIDRRLIDLLDHIQDHFGIDTVEIISGYRSPEFNNDLRESGRGAARQSLHTKGMAADIHIDEVSEEAVWKYVKSLGVGGAGFYPCYDFVHVDVGRQAAWAEPDCAQRKLVGMDNNPNPDWKIVTNKNNYSKNDVISFTVNPSSDTSEDALRATSQESSRKSPNVLLRGGTSAASDSSKVYSGNAYLEKFRRGVWKKQKDIDFSSKKFSAKDLPCGKYRIVYGVNPPAYSNEFYIKKK